MNTCKRPIYLDHHATTPVDRRVVRAMLPYFTEVFGNPASRGHAHGEAAAWAVARARRQVRQLIGASLDREIVFTSGATEANNLALQGVFGAQPEGGAPPHLITTTIEHPSVHKVMSRIEAVGGQCTRVGVSARGLVDPAELEAAITPNTVLISVMAVNNEIGTIQPLKEIGEIARRHGVLFHTDATQAAGRVDIDVERDRIDLLSLSAHKLYGPRGVGALYVRRFPNRVELAPLYAGGGQEGGIRPGTINVPGVVGFGAAAELAREEFSAEAARLRELSARFLGHLREAGLEFRIHGCRRLRVPGNLNIAFPGVPGDALMYDTPTVSFSTSSACSARSPGVSRTLTAIGLSNSEAREAIRLGLGRHTTAEQIDRAAEVLVHSVLRLRRSLGTDTRVAG